MKHWLTSYGENVPADINADAYPSVVALLESSAEKYADKPAFTCFGRSISYGETLAKSRAVSAWL